MNIQSFGATTPINQVDAIRLGSITEAYNHGIIPKGSLAARVKSAADYNENLDAKGKPITVGDLKEVIPGEVPKEQSKSYLHHSHGRPEGMQKLEREDLENFHEQEYEFDQAAARRMEKERNVSSPREQSKSLGKDRGETTVHGRDLGAVSREKKDNEIELKRGESPRPTQPHTSSYQEPNQAQGQGRGKFPLLDMNKRQQEDVSPRTLQPSSQSPKATSPQDDQQHGMRVEKFSLPQSRSAPLLSQQTFPVKLQEHTLQQSQQQTQQQTQERTQQKILHSKDTHQLPEGMQPITKEDAKAYREHVGELYANEPGESVLDAKIVMTGILNEKSQQQQENVEEK